MVGFDCRFVEKPPKVLQTHCPVCLLVLREPHQAECCGKSFCKECISKIKARNQPCPTCSRKDFVYYQNLGLQQPLYGFCVFCSNKESGCAWEGELGQLDQHINSNPDKEKQLVGCGYTNVSCVYCEGQHQRQKIEEHQASLCVKRPFTCSMCKDYESTYDDVVNSHAPVCKCRPVECPNSCGADNLQHQHLEEHVSSQCPLTLVECEFSEAGCAAKMHRKDLPSHLTDNIVTHMSLLAKENRKLKLQLEEITMISVRNPPIDFLCPSQVYYWNKATWLSEKFIVCKDQHVCTLQLKADFTAGNILCLSVVKHEMYGRPFEFTVKVTVILVDQREDVRKDAIFTVSTENFSEIFGFSIGINTHDSNNIESCHVKKGYILLRITKIEIQAF